MSIEIKRSDKYVDYYISAPNNRGYITIDTSDWIDKPWMFYELPSLKFEIYTETNDELIKYQNFSREIRTYNPVYSPLGILNVTIDIRNVPTSFILRITPIFDNDAISARNMLIENGIENGELWGIDQGIPTQSFDLNIEFIECSGGHTPPTPPAHEETVSGTTPITLDGSTGEPPIKWIVYGKFLQNGTPTPDAPIEINGVGDRTANLFDKADIAHGWFGNASTEFTTSTTDRITVYAKCKPDTTYTIQKLETSRFVIATSSVPPTNGAAINTNFGSAHGTSGTITTGDHDNYIWAWIYLKADDSQIDTQELLDSVMIHSGSTALPYEPYGYKATITSNGATAATLYTDKPLYGTGDVLDEYYSTGKIVRKWGVKVFDGTETGWNRSAHYTGGFYISWSSIATGLPEAVPFICSHAVFVESFGIDEHGENHYYYGNCTSDSDCNLWLINSSSLSDLKSYLADQYDAGTPVTIVYPFATPTEETITAPLLMLDKGTNIIDVDTTVKPEMSITYMKES